jgi:hypothetical protein
VLEIEELLAKQAITEVLYRYCRGLDRMDYDLSYSVWHEGGTAHYSGLFEGTGHGFVDWVMQLHSGMEGHSHQVTNVLIEFSPDGARAASEAYVTVRLRTRNEQGDAVDILGSGRYLDRWSKRDGRWAIDHRRYVGDLSGSLPTPPASAQGRIPPAGTVARAESRRDPLDPSYEVMDLQ